MPFPQWNISSTVTGPYLYGLKLRIGKDISKGMSVVPLVKSVRFAGLQARIFLHATASLVPIPGIVSEMGPGDVLCHTFQKMEQYNVLDENGKVFSEVLAARERGVIFDSAQGRIHCSFEIAKKAIDQGLCPDAISSDLTTYSAYQKRLFSAG